MDKKTFIKIKDDEDVAKLINLCDSLETIQIKRRIITAVFLIVSVVCAISVFHVTKFGFVLLMIGLMIHNAMYLSQLQNLFATEKEINVALKEIEDKYKDKE